MTEDEAKTKWCPYVRFERYSTDRAAPNRSAADQPLGRCIASACMAWRWLRSPEATADTNRDGPMFRKRAAEAQGREVVEWETVYPIGICGLAGAP